MDSSALADRLAPPLPSARCHDRTLSYLALDGTLASVDIGPRPPLTVGRPQRVLTRAYFNGTSTARNSTYDVSPDGQRFLMVNDAASPAERAPTLVVVKHWFEELRRLVPPVP